jgi:hypothetical protein
MAPLSSVPDMLRVTLEAALVPLPWAVVKVIVTIPQV